MARMALMTRMALTKFIVVNVAHKCVQAFGVAQRKGKGRGAALFGGASLLTTELGVNKEGYGSARG